MLEQICTIDKSRVIEYLDKVNFKQMAAVEVTPEQIAREQAAVDRHKQHLQNRKKKKREQKRMETTFQNLDQDDQFFLHCRL